MSAAILPMPGYEQSKTFANGIRITNEAEWNAFITGQTRQELFSRVVSFTSKRIIFTDLEDMS
jgi:hypothetical protein